MSFAVDPVISNIFFTLSVLLHAAAPTRSLPDGTSPEIPPTDESPHLLVLLPFYQEVPQAVEKTFQSVSNQSYPSENLHVRCIVEENDSDSEAFAREHEHLLSHVDFEILTNKKEGMKAGAMNYALEREEIDTEYLVIYDGDDEFEEDQLMKMVGIAEEHGYDAVMPRVYRTGESLMSKLLTLDTHVWSIKILPFLHRRFGVFPLSGEGCFLRRSAVEDVGGFPHSLTEDAMMAVALAENGYTFGLTDSRVYEQAPTSMKGHYTQRLRWNRGYFTCLLRTLKADLPWKKKAGFILPFVSPITSLCTLPVWILFIGFWIAFLFGGIEFIAPWMTSDWYLPFLYWSVLLGYLGNLFIIFSNMQAIAGTDFEPYAPYALLLPLYWIFLSVSAIGSVFRGTKQWGRTDRSR